MTSPHDSIHSRHFRTAVYQLRANVASRNGVEEAYSRLIAIVLRFTGKALKVLFCLDIFAHQFEGITVSNRFVIVVGIDVVSKHTP